MPLSSVHGANSRQSGQECYTTHQPDGTVVTTTTRTRTKYVEDMEYGCGMGTINERYCCKPPGILRILEIVSDFLQRLLSSQISFCGLINISDLSGLI